MAAVARTPHKPRIKINTEMTLNDDLPRFPAVLGAAKADDTPGSAGGIAVEKGVKAGVGGTDAADAGVGAALDLIKFSIHACCSGLKRAG